MGKQSNSKRPSALKWQFDISSFRLLGRELITDRITALFELVKNSYDSNADNVFVEFFDINPLSESSKIIIRDDGLGMSLDDVRNKWMIVGTSSKRRNKYSPKPYSRKVVGKKGVGRFAVDKLGSKVSLKTKMKGDKEFTCLQIDFSEYEKLSEKLDKLSEEEKEKLPIKYFTDIENTLKFESGPKDFQGTTIEISLIRDTWVENDIERAYKELAKLVSPLQHLQYAFNIILNADTYDEYKNVPVESKVIQFATKEIDLYYHKKTNKQDVLKFNDNKLEVIQTDEKSFGPVRFKLYYFDQAAKNKFKREYKGGSIDGIKIYRDGLITTPFAEYESQDVKKRDILGIDKRRYSGFFEKLSSNDLIGILEITDEHNPNIKESTNRQDFEDNPNYRELKKFIIEQIEELEKFLKSHNEQAKQQTKSELKEANLELKAFNEIVKDIKKSAPDELKQQLSTLEKQSRKVQIDINRGIKSFNKLEAEKTRQENLFLSIMSLQDYAFEIAHVVRTSLTRITRLAEFIKDEFPNEKYNDLFISYSSSIYDEMTKLDGAVDFLLSYARSNTDFKEINLKTLIERLFTESYSDILKKEKIKYEVEIDRPLIITHNEKFFEDIFENLISNSIKSLKGQNKKIIKCTGLVQEDQFILYFSDNGTGIPEEDWERIFNIYYTTTAEEGGAGLGLYIVKTRIESMKGTVEVVDNELKPTGATFKISLPFRNQDA